MDMTDYGAPERKYHQPEAGLTVTDGVVVSGYASLFGRRDQGGDVVLKQRRCRRRSLGG